MDKFEWIFCQFEINLSYAYDVSNKMRFKKNGMFLID